MADYSKIKINLNKNLPTQRADSLGVTNNNQNQQTPITPINRPARTKLMIRNQDIRQKGKQVFAPWPVGVDVSKPRRIESGGLLKYREI